MHSSRKDTAARLPPFADLSVIERADDLMGVTVGLVDGVSRVVAHDLAGISAEEVEAIARELEAVARHLRDGWRGRVGVLH